MAVVGFELLKNLKIKHKITFTFVVLFLLLANLGALNVTSVLDLKDNTDRIADEFVPRLVQTDELKNSLNLSLLAAYDYVQTGNAVSKSLYEQQIDSAVDAEIELFLSSNSEADIEFTTSFEEHINALLGSLSDLVTAYELGEGTTEISAQLRAVSIDRDAFSQFLEVEIQEQIRAEVENQQAESASQVQNTILNVSIVIVAALIAFMLLSWFTNRSITTTVKKLTTAAEKIGKGQFSFVDIDSKDELGLFADTFNTMTQNIKATQESLEIELEKTKKLDRQKTEFLSIAAHQLRTPMSGIKWLVNMVVEGDLGKVSKEAEEQLGKGLENIDRMVALINSLLDVSQIEMQKTEFNIVAADMVEITQGLIEEFDHNAQDGGIKLVCEHEAKVVPAKADIEKIKMAIRNLLDNAIKYTPKKGKVTTRVSQNDTDIIIEVIDTGHGIPDDEQDRIFSKFYRGSNIQTVEADGSGLGLFVVQQIIEQHGGDITFESTVGKGTTFRIELPKADKNTPKPGSEPEPKIVKKNPKKGTKKAATGGSLGV